MDTNTPAMSDHVVVKNHPLAEIGELLRTQDNRCTADPMFCVQALKRIYGEECAYSFDDGVWIDTDDGWREIDEPENDEQEAEYEANEYYKKYSYEDEWETVMVTFTEEGAKEHLQLHGHRYSHFQDTRIFVESFYRCPEMLAIRKYLMELPKEPSPEMVPMDSFNGVIAAVECLRDIKGRYNTETAYRQLMEALDSFHERHTPPKGHAVTTEEEEMSNPRPPSVTKLIGLAMMLGAGIPGFGGSSSYDIRHDPKREKTPGDLERMAAAQRKRDRKAARKNH